MGSGLAAMALGAGLALTNRPEWAVPPDLEHLSQVELRLGHMKSDLQDSKNIAGFLGQEGSDRYLQRYRALLVEYDSLRRQEDIVSYRENNSVDYNLLFGTCLAGVGACAVILGGIIWPHRNHLRQE